jgi:hypothetical protein
MKFLFVIFGFVAVVFQTAAQTNNFKSGFETITNWVKPGPYLRVVNGITYNIAYSKLWGDISKHEHLGVFSLDPSDSGESSHLCGSVRQVSGTTISYDILRAFTAHETYTGVPYETRSEYVKSVIILNCPNPEKMVTGEGAKFFCMKTTNYINGGGVSFTTYDCGVQATNVVPVVKKVKAEVISTSLIQTNTDTKN